MWQSGHGSAKNTLCWFKLPHWQHDWKATVFGTTLLLFSLLSFALFLVSFRSFNLFSLSPCLVFSHFFPTPSIFSLLLTCVLTTPLFIPHLNSLPLLSSLEDSSQVPADKMQRACQTDTGTLTMVLTFFRAAQMSTHLMKNPQKSATPPTCRAALNQVKPQVKPQLQSPFGYRYKVQRCSLLTA